MKKANIYNLLFLISLSCRPNQYIVNKCFTKVSVGEVLVMEWHVLECFAIFAISRSTLATLNCHRIRTRKNFWFYSAESVFGRYQIGFLVNGIIEELENAFVVAEELLVGVEGADGPRTVALVEVILSEHQIILYSPLNNEDVQFRTCYEKEALYFNYQSTLAWIKYILKSSLQNQNKINH